MQVYDRNAFGERLKLLRTERELGQNALAKEIDVSNASISLWETGKQLPSAEAVFKIATFFNVSSDYLLGLKDW